MSQPIQNSARRLHRGIGASFIFGAALIAASGGGAWAQSTAPVDTTKLIVGEGSSGTIHAPLYIANQEGFFKKAGLDVTEENISGGTPSAMAAFASGAVNILNLSGPELVEYTAKKVVSGKAFGEITDNSYDLLVARSITNIQDIKGKTIGISSPNSGDQIFILGLMGHYGISPDDVTFITAGNPINRVTALASGAIQVTAATSDLRTVELKVGNVIVKSTDSPVPFPTNLLIANGPFLAAHKPLLQKMLVALGQTTAWMKANPAAAAADCAKAYGATVEACTASNAIAFDPSVSSPYTWSSTFAVNVDGMKSAIAVMNGIEPDTKSVTVDDIVDSSIGGTKP